MSTKHLFFLLCVLAISLTVASARADGRHSGSGGRPAFVRSAPRFVSGVRGAPASFQRWHGNWTTNQRFVSPYRSAASWRGWNGRTGVGFARNGNWNWHHHHDHFVFAGGFGFPWYYPFSYYGYYPYGYYPYGYDPYAYYGSGYYPDMGPGYGSGYDDSGQSYDDSRYERGGHNSHSVVAQVQERLARDGYYKGPVDGLTGSRTYYALRAYQRDHHLRVDGAISDQLLAEMGIR